MARSRRKRSNALSRLTPHLPKLALALAVTAALGGGAYFATRQSPQDFLEKGTALYQAGDLKAAEIQLKNAVQAMPDNAEARARLGQLHFAKGDLQSAEKELKKARELGLTTPQTLILYARTLLTLGEAKRLLEEIPPPAETLDAETRAATFAFRARAQLILKEQDATQESLAQADAQVSDHPETLITRALLAVAADKAADALPLTQKAIGKAPDRSDFWQLQGDLYRKLDQPGPAQEAYSKAIQLEAANIRARLSRAQLLIDGPEFDKASPDVEEVLKRSPNDVMGRYFKAYIAFRHGKLADANALLQDILRNVPDFLPGHLLAGATSVGLGNKEAARFHLDKVLAASPSHPLARKLMASTLADLGDLDKAETLLASFGSQVDDPQLNVMQGQIALRQGNFSEAIKLLEQVSDPNLRDARYYTELAAGHMGTGDTAGAVQALTKASELDQASSRPELMLVMTHLREKRYADALQIIEKMAREKPDDPMVYNLRGGIFLSQENIPQAKVQFEKALSLKPDFFPAAHNLVLIDLRDKNIQSARNRMQQVLKHDPRSSRAWQTLASLDARQGNEAAYLSNLEKAKQADEKAPQPRMELVRYWLGKNEAGKALVEARSALDATGLADFNEHIGLAQAAQGDHGSALATYTKWAETHPRNPVAHFRLAQEQQAAKDKPAALKSLDRALALKPDFPEATISKALLLGQTGRTAEGLSLARAMQTKAPKSPLGYLAEAEVLFGDKQYAAAGKLFAQSARLADNTAAIVRAHHAYTLAGQPEEGQKLLSQWLVAHPTDGLVRHEYALSLLNTRQYRESAEQYRQLTRTSPRDKVAHNNLAWLLGELQDKDAISVAEQALKLDPDSPATLDTLGWILVNMGDAKKGLQLLEKAHGKAPAAAEIHWHLASALVRTGDRGRARQELEKLIYSGQNFNQKEEAKRLLESLQ
ncbi:MAG: XrtA/PEP-CTERM system TPR-repeat protein PrsT [Pseudomonadota bacterium]